MIGGAAALVYFNQDKVIGLFVSELNRHLDTEVAVGAIDLTFIRSFPKVAIHIKGIKAKNAIKSDERDLAVASDLFLSFDLYNILKGRYVVDEIALEDATVHVVIDKNGKASYDIFKKDTVQTAGSGQQLEFDLRKVSLKNVNVVYDRPSQGQRHEFLVNKAMASLEKSGENFIIGLEGDMRIAALSVDGDEYFHQKQIGLATNMTYMSGSQVLMVRESEIAVDGARFSLGGSIDLADRNTLDLTVEAKNSSIASLLSLLPSKVSKALSKYDSKGDIYLKGTVQGATAGGAIPLVNIGFGGKGASIFHPDTKTRLTDASFIGEYTNGAKRSAATSVLSLKDVRAKLGGESLEAKVTIKNFADAHLDFHVSTRLNVRDILDFYPVEDIAAASGNLRVDLNFSGKPDDLKTKGVNAVKASGEINLENVNIDLKGSAIPYRALKGDFIFNKNDLAISNFTGKVGSSDFLMDGYFKNVFGYLFHAEEPIGIYADVSSSLIDLNELLGSGDQGGSGASGGGQAGGGYEFNISRRLKLDLKCKVKTVRFRRFESKSNSGRLLLSSQKAEVQDLKMKVAGGSLALDAKVDATDPASMPVSLTSRISRMAVDSFFYVMEDFGQEFITSKHLDGDLDATVKCSFITDRNLAINDRSIQAQIDMSLKDGELNDFPPMQKLSRFLDDHELANLRFEELKNHINIQNRIIAIPEMTFVSNVQQVSLSGTHTFDNLMNYKIKIPISKKMREDRDSKFGEIEQVADGDMNLFLTMTGTPDDLKISYDGRRVKNKVKEDLQKEKKELKDIFQKDDPKDNSVELDEEEFFDF